MLQEGPYFASAGDDIKLWDSSKFQIVKQYNFHKGNVKDLAWSSDNSYLCSASSGGDKILLTDCFLNSKDKVKIVAEHAIGEHQTCVRISVCGRKLYSGGVDGNICVWDTEKKRARKIYKDTHSNPITCIALNASETHVASGSSKGDVIIRNLSSDVMSKPDDLGDGLAIRGMSFSPWKQSLLGITMDDGSVSLWDTLQGKPYHNFAQIHSAPSMDLIFSPLNDLVLASVGLDKHLMVFDVKRRKYLNKVKADHPLTSLTFLRDGYSMFAGSSLGCIYHYDLRNFNSVVRSMQAHTSSVQRIALQNTIKVRKERSSKSNRSDRPRTSEMSRDSESTGDETVEKKLKTTEVAKLTLLDGRGDYFDRGKIVTSSTASTSSDGVENNAVSNGYHYNHQPKPVENSTPAAKLLHDFDDMGGIISPLREDVFGDVTMISADGSLPTYDPSLMRSNFSSSRDTFGSYCDDVLSPVANVARSSKGRISAGTQIYTKTSPHPLRQSNNAIPEKPAVLRNSATSFKALTSKARAEAALKDSENSKLQHPSSQRLAALPPKSPSTSHPSSTSALQQGEASERPLTSVAVVAPDAIQSASPLSVSSALPGPSAGEMSGFQYQAEYLRNTVKEMIDELGDDLRRQINGVLNSMVKISLQQDELYERRLNERVCGINEQILKECQRLREENERLRNGYS